jgi:hypothetical protein
MVKPSKSFVGGLVVGACFMLAAMSFWVFNVTSRLDDLERHEKHPRYRTVETVRPVEDPLMDTLVRLNHETKQMADRLARLSQEQERDHQQRLAALQALRSLIPGQDRPAQRLLRDHALTMEATPLGRGGKR